MKRSAGFTLIEILIVVAIICVMLASAVTSVASGRDAARARAAARGVAQMSHYANALAILRQRPAVISFSGNSITVQLSGEGVDTSEVGSPAPPIYQEVNGEKVEALLDETEDAEGTSADGAPESAIGTGPPFTSSPALTVNVFPATSESDDPGSSVSEPTDVAICGRNVAPSRTTIDPPKVEAEPERRSSAPYGAPAPSYRDVITTEPR